jgi:hypothetical protein
MFAMLIPTCFVSYFAILKEIFAHTVPELLLTWHLSYIRFKNVTLYKSLL